MFTYEYEKPKSHWHPPRGSFPSRTSEGSTRSDHSSRALPTPPGEETRCSREHSSKPTVPLKVWIVATASCFAVCASLVLATVVITKWGTGSAFSDSYYQGESSSIPEAVYHTSPKQTDRSADKAAARSDILDDQDDVNRQAPEIYNTFNSRAKKINTLQDQPQIHPVHDHTLHHTERKIQKKDQPKHPDTSNMIPEFKPTLPDFTNPNFKIKLPEDLKGLQDYEGDYVYNDENLYDDYMQSNSMTNYLIEKVQELYIWITTDPDFDANNGTRKADNHGFGQVLKALNESLVEGNVTIVMNKLKDIYFGANYTNGNYTRKVILSNSTDLLSFGILSLDVMLLHNIQLMAWENQETARTKMLRDPDVFAFNALFLDPAKVESAYNEVMGFQDKSASSTKAQVLRTTEDFDLGRTLLENVLEMGMSTARAAIHLGRAYKNTKSLLNQVPNRDNAHVQALSRNYESNSHALNHLQTSYSRESGSTLPYTELDCVWLLYCRNLVVTSKLNPPYGVMARINGMALRMLTGELSTNRALDTMVYEALTGWTELRCSDMFPRCSKVSPAKVVMESILQPLKKTQQTSHRSI